MSWTILLALVLGLGIALCALLVRRAELRSMQRHLAERERAVRAGSASAQLQHPVVDLSRCLGCGACVRACPEEGVLELVHGQAVVVNGARCNGIAACERSCPVGAIQVHLADLDQRRDVPALSECFEALGTPGLFLAGEVTAHARIRVALEHGRSVAREVAQRVRSTGALESAPSLSPARERVAVAAGVSLARSEAPSAAHHAHAPSEVLDLCIVGAGPAGLACALEAAQAGLHTCVLDQESALGGTVAKYPRRKLVLTEPVELPGGTRLDRASYTKEELIELWSAIARREELAIEHEVVFQGLVRESDGTFRVQTSRGERRARHVCLAIGRRGLPRKLGIPGEELPKVAYSLLDAVSYQGRRILVVGGGDSAVEAALALGEQPGNEVTLSYRGSEFVRLRARVAERFAAARANGALRVLTSSRLLAIEPESVELECGAERVELANDEVFVFAGGEPPLELLARCGVSFDPALRPRSAPIVEQGTGLVRALAAGFVLAALALGWALWHSDYYALPREARATHAEHALLRPGMGLGLGFGIAAASLVLLNLAYLARRAASARWAIGSLPGWMTLHVATGIVALVAATLHAAMAPGDSVGSHALWLLGTLFVTGAIGRYVYAWVPRAANGRELELSEVRRRLDAQVAALDPSQRSFAERVQAEVFARVEQGRWRGHVFARLAGLALGRRRLARALEPLARAAREERVPEPVVRETLELARQAWTTAQAAAHYEELRGVLASWRWLHRWMAVLLLVLLGLHIVQAWIYGNHLFGGGGS